MPDKFSSDFKDMSISNDYNDINLLSNESLKLEKMKISLKVLLENSISGVKDRIDVLKKKAADSIDIVDKSRAVQSFSLIHEQIFELKKVLNVYKEVSKKIDEFVGSRSLFVQENSLTIEELKKLLLILINKQKKDGHDILDKFDADYNSDMLLTIANNIKLIQKWITEIDKVKLNISDIDKSDTGIVSDKISVNSLSSGDKSKKIESPANCSTVKYTVFSDFTMKKVKEIYFLGESYWVKGLAESVCIICSVLWNNEREKFINLVDKYIDIEGKNLKIFSRVKSDYYFQNLEGTELFIKIKNKTSKELISIIKFMLYYFELNPMKDLMFYVCENDILMKRYQKN